MADDESTGTVLARRHGQPADRGRQAGRRPDLGVDGDARRGGALVRRHPQPGVPDGRAQAEQEAGRRPAPVRLRHGALLLVADRRGRHLRARRRLLDLRGHQGGARARGARQPDDLLRRAGDELPVRGRLLAQGRPPAARRGRGGGPRVLRAPAHHPRPHREDGGLRGHRRAGRHRAGRRRHHAAPPHRPGVLGRSRVDPDRPAAGRGRARWGSRTSAR